MHRPWHASPFPTQATRSPRGTSVTGTHEPTCPCSAHASHCPVHAALQHTPSIQKVLTHSAAWVHGAPGSPGEKHDPFRQTAVPVQSPASWHVVGHDGFTPSQTNGEQLGAPGFPAGSVVHTPLALAPWLTRQVSHPSSQAWSQQYPPTQCPLAQTRQFASKQSTPTTGLHVEVWGFRG